MFFIYLPNDNEKWFNVGFSNRSRAVWFAEANDLTSGDCDVRTENEEITA